MSKKLKTRKKRYKSKRSKSKSKRKRIKRSKRMALKGGSHLLATGVVAAAAVTAAGGWDGPRKCIFGDCQSHYYHFYGPNTGWWDSTERRNFKGQTTAEWLGDESKGGENNKICPKCVKRKCKPCSTTRCTNKKCDRPVIGQLVPPPGDRPGDWWELEEGVYEKISEYRHIEWSGGIYCPRCSVMYEGGRVCDKCKKPLNDFEPRKGDRLNYCDDCKKMLAKKDTFSFRGLEYGINDKLRYNEEGRQYEATIIGIYDGIRDDNKGTQVLSLILNKWNGLLDSTPGIMYRTITVIGELQISLRLLSFAKLLYDRRYDFSEDIVIYIKEKLREKISEYINVEPWVIIDDPSRAEYKKILISEWNKHKKDQLKAIADNEAEHWASAPN
jgi:hypothetical protein